MATARSNRTSAQLVDEFRALERVHWPTVWAGSPAPGRPLEDWCAQFGWTPRSAEWVLDVSSPTGQGMALHPVQERGWAPVNFVSWTPWGLSADNTSENDAVLDRAVLKVNLGLAPEPGELRTPLINITCRPPEI
ncbi:hypothetical protein SsS58_07013 [Streptomyces scabiei]|uniref:Uncharacterized protein n=1 Tax=Streptomyces scabiei TaxID=1930 RepID=A0A124C561_STRSC|nr:hypothetical protein SsS58_07013 [Streptomyces scabiei]